MFRFLINYFNYGKVMYLIIIFLVLYKYIVVICICVLIYKFIINNKEVIYIVNKFFYKNKCFKMYLFFFFSCFLENWFIMIWWNKWYRWFLMWCLISMNCCFLIFFFVCCLLVDLFKIYIISFKIKIRLESFIFFWWFRFFLLKVNWFFYMICK